MAYTRRATANPNRLTLDLDPITGDALTGQAKARKLDRHRLAYELIQQGLGISTTAPIAGSPPPEPEDDATRLMRRGLAGIKNYKPEGTP